ncbi:hypothetical protein D3870_20190 [Noviherbaspirillum cavernae]|uniref:DUF3035 domain-containing protein n=1 Tax=Noviherbaspirillum cavernae TaxID=2320862 RepID=A0A418WVW2_9BURK|nr:hypothetical protein [Noviherbaspirillum cavernae]RJF96729.1 hypothetical protein D3870_20190 [Noviherbaspirillum cavernae]
MFRYLFRHAVCLFTLASLAGLTGCDQPSPDASRQDGMQVLNGAIANPWTTSRSTATADDGSSPTASTMPILTANGAMPGQMPALADAARMRATAPDRPMANLDNPDESVRARAQQLLNAGPPGWDRD